MKLHLILFILLLSVPIYAQDYQLTIHVDNLKHTQGHVILDLFNDKKGYPIKTDNAILRKVVDIPTSGKVVFTLENLNPGEYAFALIHDENSNHALDVNFLRIPKEGAAASNNAKGFMSPPSYKDAKFNFSQSAEVTIHMLYF